MYYVIGTPINWITEMVTGYLSNLILLRYFYMVQ